MWSFALGCVFVLGMAFVLMKAMSPLYYSRASNTLARVMDAEATKRIARWGEGPTPPGGFSGVVFGDSVFAPNVKEKGFVVALEPALQQAGLNVKLLNLTHAGLGAYQFYYLSSRVLAAGPPDFAVVEVNRFTFAPDWYEEPLGRFLPMVGGLSVEQVWRVHQALATQEVGLLTPLVYRLDGRLGILQLLDGVRTFGIDTLDAVGTRANGMLGLATPSRDDRAHATIRRHVLLTADSAHRWYGREFAVSPTAEVLRALSDDLRAAGVTILYVVSPVQRRSLRLLGIEPDDLHTRTETLRKMLGASPEQWLEMTDLFQSADFLDSVHVRAELIRRMTRPVAERIAALLAARQRAPAPTADGTDHGRAGASVAQ